MKCHARHYSRTITFLLREADENTQANLSLGSFELTRVIVIESNFKRLTARANITHKVKDFLHVGLNLNYAHSEKMGGGNLRNYAQAIPTMDYVEDGVFYSMPIVLPDGTLGTLQERR